MTTTPDPITLPLHNKLLNDCWRADADVNVVVQAILDTLMISIIAASPDVDAAERNVHAITADTANNIRRAYGEFHALAHAPPRSRQ